MLMKDFWKSSFTIDYESIHNNLQEAISRLVCDNSDNNHESEAAW